MAPKLEWPYPKAFEKRLDFFDPVMVKLRRNFFKAAGQNFLYLQLLFLSLFCWIFGSLYLQTTHLHNFNIVFVDYDGGAIGQAVRDVYRGFAGDGFPTLVEQPPSAFGTPADIREAVCRTDYWAGLYVSAGSSDRLRDALQSGTAASRYNGTGAVSYIWNEARYPTVVDPGIATNIGLLSDAARVAYSIPNGTGNVSLSSLAAAGPNSLAVLANPWTLASTNIQSTPQGSRTIYNTIVIILIMMQEFFYLGTLNGLYQNFKLFVRSQPKFIILIRNIISLTYTLIGSLCTTGAIWAFRDSWNVNGNQFGPCWMILWLFAHLNFLTMDVFTIWLPLPFVPMALVIWIILNVSSMLLPFELSPAFFRVGYALPAHEVYQMLVDIWSFGCNPQQRYALPILFAWWVVSFCLSTLGVYRRSHYAWLGEEAQKREFKERLDGAVEFEMKKVREVREQDERRAAARRRDGETAIETTVPSGESDVQRIRSHAGSTVIGGRSTDVTPDEEKAETKDEENAEEEAEVRSQLSQVIERANERDAARDRRRLAACSFGPAFDVPFGRQNSNES